MGVRIYPSFVRWLQVAALVCSTSVFAARPLSQEAFTYQPDLSPALLQKSSVSAPHSKVQEVNRTFKEVIGQANALADNVQEKRAKSVLQRAIQLSKNLRYAAKAQKLKQAKVDKSLGIIDSLASKLKDKEHRRALSSLGEGLRHVCSEVLAETSPVASSHTVIDSLPYTISQGGHYCLSQNLELTDPAATGAAITVTADNVHLDLCNHDITVSPTIAAIYANTISNFSVRNGRLLCPTVAESVDSVGILMSQVSHAIFDNIVFLNTRKGAVSTHSQDLTFTRCQFTHPFDDFFSGGTAIRADNGTQGLHVEHCVFGLIGHVAIVLYCDELGAETHSATIRNCKFFNPIEGDSDMMGSAVYLASRKGASPIANVEISDCEFYLVNTTVAIEDGIGVEVRDCTFTHTSHGVRIYGGSDIIVQGCSFMSQWDQWFPSSIMVMPRSPLKNVKIKDCTSTTNGPPAIEMMSGFDEKLPAPCDVLVENCAFSSENAYGTIWVSNVSGLVVKDSILRNGKIDDCNAAIQLYSGSAVIDNCHLSGYIGCRISKEASNCEIKNCTITEGVVGVILNDGATNTVIRDNVIFGNDADGIFVDPTSSSNTIIGNKVINNGANGIFVTSAPNTVLGNSVFQNGGDGLLNTGGETNIFFDNSSCSNGGANCTGLPGATTLLPGSPAVAGGNTCCPL